MNKKLNVLLADNTPTHTHGIRSLLNHYNDYVAVKHVTDGWDIVTQTQTSPDLVVLYDNVPTPNGIELLVAIKMKYPKAKVILFTRDPEPYYRNMCELLGADYYYHRSHSISTLPESIKAMILGYQIAA